jgi:predicted nicotinamide N-methyase
MTDASRQTAFIRANTQPRRSELVPEIELLLADAMTPLWHATEDTLAIQGVEPPYWAFAWPGGQALARYLLDHPEQVRDRRVFVFAAGSGIDAIAAALAGADHVVACDIDSLACAAIALNAGINGVTLGITSADPLDQRHGPPADLVIAGDVYYQPEMSDRTTAWIRRCLLAGTDVLLADPGRGYMPDDGIDRLAVYDVPTSLDLEDRSSRRTTIWRPRLF